MKKLNSALFKKFEKSIISNIAKIYGGYQTSDFSTQYNGNSRDYDRKDTHPANSDWSDSTQTQDQS